MLKSALALVVLFASAIAAFATTGTALQIQAGNPSNATADSSNHSHYLMQRAQYALDYNDTLGQPNWVSWDLTAADHGSVSRSDFLPDPDLPSGFYAVTTTDYNGVGDINFNRGHMSPSADRNDTTTNNIPVFYMTNILPQAADNNQGPWEEFETYCRTLASAGNELLITSGGFQYLGSKIPSGKAYIPGYTWKIVLVIPTGSGTAASRATTSTRVIALKMINANGIRSNSWELYKTTVAQIAADTGFTFFTGLDSTVASALRNAPVDGAPAVASPIITTQPAAQSGPVGSTVNFSVVADANGNPPLTYQWRKDGDEIAGETNATLTLTAITATSGGSYSVVVFNTVGSTASATAALVVSGLPPSITTQPVAKSTPAGTAVSFTVAAAGSPTLSYQWRQGTTNLTNSAHISGATAPVLTINNPQAADALTYNVVVTNTVSTVTSDAVLLTVTPAAPTIATQPLAQTVAPAGTAVFTVVAAGTEPFTYQWYKGSTLITGNASATTATLTLTNLQLSDQDNYSVVVSNGIGSSATSNAVALTVSAAINAKAYTGGTYTQNFDTLPTSGTFTLSGAGPFAFSNTPFSLSALAGWSFAKISGSGSNALFNFGTGSSNAGAVYSFGAAATAERALGAVLSGTVGSAWGLVLTNNTGTTITQFTVAYTGEQWRYGGRSNVSLADTVAFEYQVGGSDIATGTFTAATSLNFSAPVYNGATVGTTTYAATAATLVGNDTGYRTAISATVTGITWAPGQALVLRWKDTDVTGSDDGLAIDDFSFTTPATAAPTVPSVVSTSPVNSATNVAVATPITVTFDQAVNVTGTWFALSSTNTGPITPTVNTTDFITFTFTPPTNLAFGDTVTLNLFAAQITEKNSGTLHPASNTTLTFTTITPTPPSIGTQPNPSTVAAGATATFSVTASGTAPLAYQWRKAGVAITGNTSATTPTLTLTNVQAGDVANYDVVVTNGINPAATSNAVALAVTPTAPTITTQPLAQSGVVNGSVSFTVAATGTTPFTYQWRKGGFAITGNASAATATLTLSSLTVGDTGDYDVVVSNGVGTSATSNTVHLTVNLTGPGQLAYSGGVYSQNFDTLPNTGTFTLASNGPIRLDDSAGINATGLGGWTFAKYAGSGSVALFRVDNGASNSGSIYSYGATSGPDRALGSLSSGSTVSRFGLTLVNTGTQTLTQFTLSYTGEQWRHGGATTANKLAFSYAVGATDLVTGTFTDATSLDFTGLSVSATGAALDGSLAANRAAVTATVTGLSWAPGQTLVLRWTDVDDSGSDDGLSVDDLTFVAPAPATVALSNLAQTYDGSPKTPTATTTPASLAVGFTYNSSPTAPTNAGSYAVAATITDPSYLGSTTGTLVIAKATATVALGNLTPVYNGTPQSATATTTPSGLNVTFTYNGSSTPPTAVGQYTVVATVNDANYSGSASAPFIINQGNVAITLAGLSATYDGTPKAVTATTTPSGLPVSLAYAGSPTPPTDAGSYVVIATVNTSGLAGTTSGLLAIAKASQTVNLGPIPASIAAGTPFTLSPTSSSGLPVTLSVVSGNASVSGNSVTVNDASAVTLRGTQAGNNNYNPASSDVTLTAGKLAQTIAFAAIPDQVTTAGPLALSATASSGLAVSFTVVSGPATVSGSTLTLAGTAGTVTVRASQAGSATYNAATDVTRSFVVTVGSTAPRITTQPGSQVAQVGGSAGFTVVATGSPAPTYQWRKDGVSISGATGAGYGLTNVATTDAGGYDVVVTNSAGFVTSSLATLTVNTVATAPVITRQPGNLVTLVGRSAAFSVTATGAPAPTYQWRKNGASISGATGSGFSIASVAVADAGAYSVVVTNSAGSVTSSSANLGVIRRSFAGAYFGALGNGGSFAMYIKDDNTGIFLGFLPGSSTAFVSRAVSVDDNGHFTFGVSLTGGAISATPAPAETGVEALVSLEADAIVLDGTISENGTLTTTGASTYALSAVKSSDAGSTAATAGFYQAGAAGGSAQTLAIVSPAGQAFVVTQNGVTADAGTGTIDVTGKITVTTAGRSTVSATVTTDSAITATVTTSGGTSTTFTGYGDTSAALAQQRIINLSTRTTAGTGDQVAIVGFVITGLESKPVLLRGVGPALRNFGLTTALAAPRLELRSNSGALVATNTGWSTSGNTAEIANAAARSGAFPLAAGSADSVILTTLAPGAYTAILSAADAKPGVGLVEVYDLSGGSTAQKLANLSTRAAVGTGEATLTSGLVVGGTVPKRVLIRAAGPTLAQFGLAGVLARPALTLYSGNTVLATNSGWSTSANASDIASSATSVGAFAFASGSADAALIVNLPPGAYTAQVAGVSGATGLTLLEVYELP
jgi:DNA/RNA endonuclease G (NUC1)